MQSRSRNSRPPADGPSGTALEAGFRLLASRPHAVREVRVKLGRRGFDLDEVESAVSRLLELGYLDDAAFSRGVVSHRAGSRGASAVASELIQKGVARDQVATAVAEIDPEADLESATVMAARHLRHLAAPTAADLQRVGARLRRRGFSESIIRRALAVPLDD